MAVAGHPLKSAEDLCTALRQKRPGDEVTVALIRDGTRKTVNVRLSDKPQ